MELKGKALPTICIEDDLVFESIIPHLYYQQKGYGQARNH
jgi:hypothetical protein